MEPEHRDSLALTKHAALLTYTQTVPDIEVISEHVGDMRGLRRAREQSTHTPAALDPVHNKRPGMNNPVLECFVYKAEVQSSSNMEGMQVLDRRVIEGKPALAPGLTAASAVLRPAFPQSELALISFCELCAMAILLPEDYILPKLIVGASPVIAKQAHRGGQSPPGSPEAVTEARSPKRRGRSAKTRRGGGSDGESGSNTGSETGCSLAEQSFYLNQYDNAELDALSSEADRPVSAGVMLGSDSSLPVRNASSAHRFAISSPGLLSQGNDSHSSGSSSPHSCDSSGNWRTGDGGHAATLPSWHGATQQQQAEAMQGQLQRGGQVRQQIAGQSSEAEAQRQAHRLEGETSRQRWGRCSSTESCAASEGAASLPKLLQIQSCRGNIDRTVQGVHCSVNAFQNSAGSALFCGVSKHNCVWTLCTLDRLRAARAAPATGGAGGAAAGTCLFWLLCCQELHGDSSSRWHSTEPSLKPISILMIAGVPGRE